MEDAPQSLTAIMKLVAAIMHIGNIKFKPQVQRKLGCDVDGCAVSTKPALEVRLPPSRPSSLRASSLLRAYA